ncbi:uncharacterized protein LOC144478274 [Augochlora pura]
MTTMYQLDALPLIEKLLADLLQTTESLKHFKSIAQDNIEAHSQLQSAIDPYKCDNARLVEECNRLHLDLSKAKESHQKQIKDLRKETHKLERECNDLQLASSRNLHRIKELEIESSRKSKKILELQGKCLKPTISNVGLASKKRPCYPLRRAVLESEPLPKTGSKVNPLPSLSTVEPKTVDLLNMADHKMNCLTHEVTKLKGELLLQTDNVQMLESQLTAKEREIIRLKKLLEGGRPYSAVSKDCSCKKMESNLISSTEEIDLHELKILQQEKLELEQQLKEALNKQHDAMTQALKLADRNEELEKELRDIDHIALAVEADCNSAVKENNEKVSKLQQKLQDLMTQVHILEGELIVERREVQELRADLEACRLEKRNMQRNLESTLDEKKHIIDRINELTVIEKNLNDEIERLSSENERQRQDVIQLQYSNKLLKEQIHTKESLQTDAGVALGSVQEKGKKNDYNRGQNGINIQEMCRGRDININSIEYESIRKQLDEKETRLSNLEQGVEKLRRERDFYKNEYNNVKDRNNKTIEKDHDDLWSRIRELKYQLSEKETMVDELQREKNELVREKTNLEGRLQSHKTDHKHFHRPCNICKRSISCNCSPPTFRDTNTVKGIIERLEHERDMARADIERLREERDALRERLKIAVEAHTSEQRRLRETLSEVETRLKQIEKERQELLLSQGARRATINGLEDQLEDLREELKRTKQELSTQRTQYFQLRALQDQTDQSLGDTQNQLTQSKSELNKALDRNRTMERQQLQFENQIKDLQQEINHLKTNMTHLDHEKDQLLMVLDEKTEKIAALEREMMLKDQQIVGCDHQMRELQHKNELTIEKAADQERQMRAMQLEMENYQRQLQTSTYDRENAIQENRRIQDDLAACTCEVRNMQRELEASRAESFDLKRQLQTYVSEVRRAEELLNRKENERTEMLNHFRSLSLEATVLENNNHSLESEAAEARGALQTARDRVLDLERQLADKESLISGYETQISELTQNVASMETQLRQQEEQKQRTESDLTVVRDLCMKLDQQKDTLMHQLDDKDSIKEQYDMQISKLKAEQTIIQDQMNRDRATVERLEMLLDQARQKSITVQANNQELQNEMSRLKTKMSDLQSRLSSESAKLRQYQTQAAEYSKQISELRREMTNERFDRARKEEESRRHLESHDEDSSKQYTSSPSNNRIPNGSNDTVYRSLQSEEHVPAINKMQTTNEVYRGIPCINIILRSDSTMKSTQYNCTQRDNSQYENENKNQSSSQRRYEQISIRTEKQLNSLPVIKAQCEPTLFSDNIQTNSYMTDKLSGYNIKYSNKIPDITKNPIELVKKKLTYSDNDTLTVDTRMVGTKLKKDSNEDSKVVADVNRSKQNEDIKYNREAWETSPVTKLKKAPGRVYEGEISSTRSEKAEELVKKNVLTFVEANSRAEHNQLGQLCNCSKYYQKYKAPFKYEKHIFDKIVPKNIDTGEQEENCCINADHNSINCTALNVEQHLKSNTNYNSMEYSKLKMSPGTKSVKPVADSSIKVSYRIAPENETISQNATEVPNCYTNKNCDSIYRCLAGQETKSVNTTI